jgi:hypothetical protein
MPRYKLRTLLILLAVNFSLAVIAFICTSAFNVNVIYDTMPFRRNSGTYTQFTSCTREETVASIYLRLKDDTVVCLPDITRRQVATIIPYVFDPLPDSWHTNNRYFCAFTNGRLTCIKFASEADVELSPGPDGPFVKLGDRSGKYTKAFGRPKKVEWYLPRFGSPE